MATAGLSELASFSHVPPDELIFGSSEAMQALQRRLAKAARTNAAVLIQGESGTGKEVIAAQIHLRSQWRTGPFVIVACPTIPVSLVESELFGYERGSFTGANASKPGRFELAHQGTLFLDEIAESDPALQAKLLQVLQDGSVNRIGSRHSRRVEFRVICATKHDLESAVEAGAFRPDLFYRVNVVNIKLPPLRERLSDIPALVSYFIGRFNAIYGCQAPPLTADSLRLLQSSSWPGNIRELENLVKRYVVLGSERVIGDELPGREYRQIHVPSLRNGSLSLKKMTRQAVQHLEHHVILNALKAHNWNRKRTARALNISYRALLYKLKEAHVPQKSVALAQEAFGISCQE